MECLNPDGTLAWRKSIYNDVLALTDLLSVYFASGTQKPNWYVGLIDNSGFTGLSPSDTMSSHPGWSENQDYTQATRPQWSPSIGGGVAVNPSPAVFTFVGADTLKGIFLASNNTKGGTSGTLWSTALFGALQSVTPGQVWRVIYNLRAAGGG